MSLNKSGIEWTEYTWNPIVGCKHGCWYCYARELATERLAKMPNACPQCATFEPHFHEERLKISHGKPKTIFFGSMCDAWGDWVPKDWIEKCLTVMREHPEHTFLAPTKNARRFRDFELPDNLWIGATVTGRDHFRRQLIDLRKAALGSNRFINFEPLLEDVADLFSYEGISENIYQYNTYKGIIIGPLNKPGWDPVTKRSWVERIIEIAREAGIPVFLKDACVKIGYTMEEMESRRLRELPWNLHT